MPTHIATARRVPQRHSSPLHVDTGLLVGVALLGLFVTLAALGIVTPPDFAQYGSESTGMMMIGP